jgi:glycosyltransferase involved in cell wall biosynthesis
VILWILLIIWVDFLVHSISLSPLVSVIICVYNGERYLALTLDSVLSQTYANIEILIVNDGSRDGSQAIIEEYAARDARIRWFSRVNSGLPASRNFAFAEARGEWIAVIDQDDLCYPERVEMQLGVAAKYPTAGFIFCDTDYIDEAGKVTGSHLKSFVLPDGFIPKKTAGNLLLVKGCFIDSEAWFFRKNVASSLEPLIESLRYACDYEYFIRVGLHFDFAYTRETLAAWRIHPAQESATNKKRFYEHRLVLKRYFLGADVDFVTRCLIVKNLARSHGGEIYRWLKSKLRTA